MSVRKVKEVSGLDKLLLEVKEESGKSRKMSSEELFNYIKDNFNEVSSKNGMLKKLRGEGLSCSMDRVFSMFMRVDKVIDKEVKEVKENDK